MPDLPKNATADVSVPEDDTVTPPAVVAEPILDLEGADLSNPDLWHSIAALEHVDTVQYLRLTNAHHTDARALVRLAALCPHTRVLELRACPQLLGSDLAALGVFRHLAALKLGDNEQLDDTAIEGLLECQALSFLELVNATAMSGHAIGRLADLSGITSLLLGGAKGVDDDCVRRLTRLPELADLRLVRCPIGVRALEDVGRCARLQHLNLNGCERLGNDAVEAVSRCAELVELRMSGCRELTDGIWPHLARLSRLRALSLSGARALSDSGAAVVARFPALRELRARDCPGLGDGAANALSHCRRLHVLDAAGWKGLSHVGVAAIAQSCELRELAVSGLDDRGLESLGSATGLRVLALRGCARVTANGFRGLASLVRLEELALLEGTPASQTILESLRTLPTLREVVVERARGAAPGSPGRVPGLDQRAGFRFHIVESAPASSIVPERLTIARTA